MQIYCQMESYTTVPKMSLISLLHNAVMISLSKNSLYLNDYDLNLFTSCFITFKHSVHSYIWHYLFQKSPFAFALVYRLSDFCDKLKFEGSCLFVTFSFRGKN